MITSLPAVQRRVFATRAPVFIRQDTVREERRLANRRYRRRLNYLTRRIQADTDRWWSETFSAPSLSSRDLW